MANNLRGNPTNPDDQRPFQRGAAQGRSPAGGNANESKLWLIDTGAMISAISVANAANFDTTPVGGGAVDAGGNPLPIVRGITMLFKVKTDDSAYPGGERNVSCRLPVAIVATSDIIGMDQLEEQKIRVEWNPEHRKGNLFEVTGKRRHG